MQIFVMPIKLYGKFDQIVLKRKIEDIQVAKKQVDNELKDLMDFVGSFQQQKLMVNHASIVLHNWPYFYKIVKEITMKEMSFQNTL
jgi:hypothetical protein